MVWSYLFDNDLAQRSDIERIKAEAETNSSVSVVQNERLAAAEKRIGQLELTVEALVRVLEAHSGLSRDELTLLIQRIDLADGVEDGVLGPDHSESAPKCGSCGRPINPRRQSCLFCNAPADARAKKTPQRQTTCISCGQSVPELTTYISERGVLCAPCYRKAK